MSTDDLTRLSACAVVDLLARGEISPADLLDAAEARIAETDSVLNALPTLCFDRAHDLRVDGFCRSRAGAFGLYGGAA